MNPLPHRILVLDLGGLGDEVHLLPALRLIRRQWPQAELQVMVNSHTATLFKMTHWVDHVWPYAKPARHKLRTQWQWMRKLHALHFDVVIDTKSTDRSSILSWATRAPVRLGRRPADGGPWGWRLLFTGVMDTPYYTEPMYLQKWHALRQAGFGDGEETPKFDVRIDPALRRAAGISPEDEHQYLHVSPCTTADARELPTAQLATLIDRLLHALPALRCVLSCAGSAREQEKLKDVVDRLSAPPWKIFPGTLDIPSLASVISTARLNLSGDTGSLHLAMMTRAPALAWFRHHRGEREWIPAGPQYRVLIAPDTEARDAIHGLETEALFEAAAQLLEAGTPVRLRSRISHPAEPDRMQPGAQPRNLPQ